MEKPEACCDAESECRACNMTNTDGSSQTRNKKYTKLKNKSPKKERASEGNIASRIFNRFKRSFSNNRSSDGSTSGANNPSE